MAQPARTSNKRSIGTILYRDFAKNKLIYLMALPVMAYYIIFHYGPMYGLVIAFKYFAPAKGILGSPWAGVYWFREFFNSYFIERLIKNTLLINVLNLLFSFPAPIILALLLKSCAASVTSARSRRSHICRISFRWWSSAA
jgi:putative aldouronate transport system permease protein